ncbi:LOB domain-containing protein 6-like [Olea europaea var. sylvestris]|uniref:LOB domain-containing protein 6-like n=1 Tax=Olea europaea var. sylvestris TaxID=158386 RepID=UPI000C1D6AB6|nr:LOB domain-containing protein 6-like [Olea europaea var. sylvestris]
MSMHMITIFLNIFNFSSFYLLSPNSLYNVPYELNINTDNNKCVMASVCGSVLVAITTRITQCVLPSHYNNSGFHIVSILIASTTQETSTSYKSPNNSDLSIQYSLVPIHSDGTTVRLRESVLIRPDQPQKFANVHKVFGASNVTKLLNELQAHQREDAVNSLAYEADMRLRDPVYGCVGVISLLQHQLRQLQMDLSCAKSELSKYQNLGITGHGLIAAAATATHHHQQNFGINLIGGGVGSRDHPFHHQFFPSNQQQVIRSFDGENGYDASSLLAMNVSASIGHLSQFQ